MEESATYYRDFAKRCRAMARGTETKGTAETLLQIAEEYEAKAEKLERAERR